MAPSFNAPASNTAVFSSIMRKYSATDTSVLFSKSMSYCCPSHTPTATSLKTVNNRGSDFSSQPASNR